MCYNAELLSRPDGESQRITVESWLRSHRINYDENMTTQELIDLYIYTETHISY